MINLNIRHSTDWTEDNSQKSGLGPRYITELIHFNGNTYSRTFACYYGGGDGSTTVKWNRTPDKFGVEFKKLLLELSDEGEIQYISEPNASDIPKHRECW